MAATCSRMSSAWIVVNDVAKRLYSSTTLSRSAKTSSVGTLAAFAPSELDCGKLLSVIPNLASPWLDMVPHASTWLMARGSHALEQPAE